ncbi:hypothetical protein [Nonomuraea sp. NEAU-A123]|uniref:hypothetical protein n=1 Tax=Nonomuraea sp. NEAU-A123 TaxID=2839649 RepID=UPI001BE3F9B9|nr:hypothetical protein [Nonomuraea sp. NEAU-A123]MBT2234657.1 hypothetical protein [Nonomuraea sp. NEAU-A123]
MMEASVQPAQTLVMPGTVRAARTIMCVQMVLTLVLTAILALLFTQVGWNAAVLLPLLYGIASAVVIVLVVVKMSSRRKWVRWTGIGIQGVNVISFVVGAFTGAPGVGELLGLGLSVAVIALLLVPSSTAWFDA